MFTLCKLTHEEENPFDRATFPLRKDRTLSSPQHQSPDLCGLKAIVANTSNYHLLKFTSKDNSTISRTLITSSHFSPCKQVLHTFAFSVELFYKFLSVKTRVVIVKSFFCHVHYDQCTSEEAWMKLYLILVQAGEKGAKPQYKGLEFILFLPSKGPVHTGPGLPTAQAAFRDSF